MTSKLLTVWTGPGRSTPRGVLALTLAGTLLLAAMLRAGRPAPPTAGQPAAARQDAEHATALLNAVRGAHPVICRLASQGLGNRWGGARTAIPGPESIGQAGDAVFEWALTARVEPPLIPQLRAALADPDGCVRRTAAVLLGRAGTTPLGPELRAELTAASATTREAALLAIGYAGNAGDVPPAVAALSDPDPAARLAAVWALGMIGDPAAVQPLAGMLKDRDPALRATAAFALGRTDSADAIPALAAILGSDADPRVRRAAAAALGQIDQ